MVNNGAGYRIWVKVFFRATKRNSPHPNPLPEYRARGQDANASMVEAASFGLGRPTQFFDRYFYIAHPIIPGLAFDGQRAGVADLIEGG